MAYLIQVAEPPLGYLKPVAENCRRGFYDRKRKKSSENISACHSVKITLPALLKRDSNNVLYDAWELCRFCSSEEPKVWNYYKIIKKSMNEHID